MTTVLNRSMTAEEIQAKIHEASEQQKLRQSKRLEQLREERRAIKAEFMKNPLKLDKSPLEIQRESRDE